MPPTMSILIELADLGSAEAVINHAKDRQIEQVLPRVVETPQRLAISLSAGSRGFVVSYVQLLAMRRTRVR